MIEKVLGLVVLGCLLIRDLLLINTDNIIMIIGSIAAFMYLVGNWWLNKPLETNWRTVITTIFYGIASSGLAFALIFQLLYLTGSHEMTLLSLGLLVGSIGIDFILSMSKAMVINSWAKWRLVILAATAILLFLIPKDYRISITYRNQPEFLKCYEANKQEVDFDVVRRIYIYNDYPEITLKDCSIVD